MRGSDIERKNRAVLDRQRHFRAAADVVTDASMTFPVVRAIAVIGSVARLLWKEVPRFREYRSQGIELWHECGDSILPSGWNLSTASMLTPVNDGPARQQPRSVGCRFAAAVQLG
jgi:hypothetical protein